MGRPPDVSRELLSLGIDSLGSGYSLLAGFDLDELVSRSMVSYETAIMHMSPKVHGS